MDRPIRMGILCGGGPAPGMNSVIAAATIAAVKAGWEVVGIEEGFSNLMAGNIAYKLMDELGDAEIIGPVLLGMAKPVHILQLGSKVREIVNISAIAVVDAQLREETL